MREPTLCSVLLLAAALSAQALEPPPEPRVRLEGLVVDPQQRPLPGASVTAEVDGEVVARTLADGSGAFVFGRLPPRLVVVRAETAAPDVGGAWVDLFGLRRTFVRIVALPARTVRGTVRDELGAPVAGAWVVAAPGGNAEIAFASCCVRSDAAGAYVLTHVPFGTALVRAWAEGCDAFEGSVDEAVDKTLDAVVTRDAGQEHEFSLRDATPEQVAAGVLVATAFHGGVPMPLPEPLRRIRADADGKWVLRGWPYADELHVRLDVPGAVTTPVGRSIQADLGGVRSSFAIAEATSRVRGRLVGDAPGGRLLVVQPRDPSALPVLRRVIGRSAADGTFDLPCPVERGEQFALRLVAEDATAGPEAAVGHEAPERCWYTGTQDSRTHAVMLRPAHSIQLRVFTPGGLPAAGALVAIHAAGRARTLPGGLVLASAGFPLAHGCSDSDGNVQIEGLDLQVGERLACLVRAVEGFAEQPFDVPAAAAIDLGRLQLGEGATLRVFVVDERGTVPGARVFCTPHAVPGLLPQIVVADRGGEVVIGGLLPTRHTCWQLSNAPKWSQLILEPGENKLELR